MVLFQQSEVFLAAPADAKCPVPPEKRLPVVGPVPGAALPGSAVCSAHWHLGLMDVLERVSLLKPVPFKHPWHMALPLPLAVPSPPRAWHTLPEPACHKQPLLSADGNTEARWKQCVFLRLEVQGPGPVDAPGAGVVVRAGRAWSLLWGRAHEQSSVFHRDATRCFGGAASHVPLPHSRQPMPVVRWHGVYTRTEKLREKQTRLIPLSGGGWGWAGPLSYLKQVRSAGSA